MGAALALAAEAIDAPGSLAVLAAAIGITAPVIAADGVLAPFSADSLHYVLFDSRSDTAAALAVQAQGIAAGAALLFIGVAPGSIQFGPLVRPGHHGCLACRDARVHNNDRRPRPAAAADQHPAASATRPLGPAALAMLAAIVGHYADAAAAEVFLGTYAMLRCDDLAFARHRFRPIAGCPHCPVVTAKASLPLHFQSRLKTNASDKRVANPALSLAALREAFVDRHSGLIKHVFQDTASALMPLCSAEMQLFAEDGFESGYGRAENAQQSELVAILEAIERHAGHRPQAGQKSVRASYAALRAAGDDIAIDPAAFILHDSAQHAEPGFVLKPYSPDLAYNWVAAQSLRHDRPVLVPEQFGYYRLTGTPAAPVNRFVFDSSSGCSLGGCTEEAALGGLYEIVERDAYFATWYSRIAPTRILGHSIDDPRSAALIARAEAEGYEIHLFDITTDIRIPVVWGMITDPRADAVVKSYCASACHGRWSEAIFSALVEITTSMGVYRCSMGAGRARAEALLRDAGAVREMPDHVLLYSLPESYERLQFLHGGAAATLAECEAALPSLTVRDIGAELRLQADKVLAVASDVVVIDQTFAEMTPLGLSCVKVLAPGLLPVTFGHQYRRIGLDRINQVAQLRDPGHAPFTMATINPHPHNFP